MLDSSATGIKVIALFGDEVFADLFDDVDAGRYPRG